MIGKIGIITYDKPHRKTQDLIARLFLNRHSDLHLIVIPWVERKSFQPLFAHRPSKCVNASIEQISKGFQIPYSRVDVDGLSRFFSENTFEYIMIAGAGLLPDELVQKHKVINSHPGYLPNVKGLDALKWAIYNGQPIGVTTHYIADKVDEGELIERKIIPVYFNDTFHNVAYRVYEAEIEMLVNSISIINSGQQDKELLRDDRYKPNKRMPHSYELAMMQRFEETRKGSNPKMR